MFDYLWNQFILRYKKVSFGQNLTINGRLHVHGPKGLIKIGNNTKINSNEDSNPTAGGIHTHLVAGPGAQIVIGNNVGISQSQISAYKSVVIDDNVLIGACCKIWDTDFHPIQYVDRVNKNEEVKMAAIHICEGAFIGACSIVLKGVTIGHHSVIGAGSVVTKDVPENEIWAGNPAIKVGDINV